MIIMAARVVFRVFCRYINNNLPLCRSPCSSRAQHALGFFVREHGHSSYAPRMLRELYNRKLEEGEKPPASRQEFLEWNYDAELFAFGARLGEEFNPQLLRQALRTASYAEKEKQHKEELGLDTQHDFLDNGDLAAAGQAFSSSCIKESLRTQLPFFPEDGICSLHDYLLSMDVLADIALHIGMKELLLSGEYPPSDAEMASAFLAVVGCLKSSSSEEKVRIFIKDFIISYLVGKDLNEIWHLRNPVGVLKEILVRCGQGEPELRLIREAGVNTILATYIVGVFSDKNCIGEGPGETLEIAVEMAARDALKRLFKSKECDLLLKFNKDNRDSKTQPNLSLESWTKQDVIKNIVNL